MHAFTHPITAATLKPAIFAGPQQRPTPSSRLGVRAARGLWGSMVAWGGGVAGRRVGRVGVSTAPPGEDFGGRCADGTGAGLERGAWRGCQGQHEASQCLLGIASSIGLNDPLSDVLVPVCATADFRVSIGPRLPPTGVLPGGPHRRSPARPSAGEGHVENRGGHPGGLVFLGWRSGDMFNCHLTPRSNSRNRGEPGAGGTNAGRPGRYGRPLYRRGIFRARKHFCCTTRLLSFE